MLFTCTCIQVKRGQCITFNVIVFRFSEPVPATGVVLCPLGLRGRIFLGTPSSILVSGLRGVRAWISYRHAIALVGTVMSNLREYVMVRSEVVMEYKVVCHP